MLREAEEGALRVGKGGPLDVRMLIEDVPLDDRAERHRPSHLRFPLAPRDRQIQMAGLTAGPGAVERLDEQGEAVFPGRGDVHALASRV